MVILLILGCQQDNEPVPQIELYSMYEISINGSEEGFFLEFPRVDFHKPDGGVVRAEGFYTNRFGQRMRPMPFLRHQSRCQIRSFYSIGIILGLENGGRRRK
nr:hypothetical protein [Membranihabitans marinus]